MASNDQNLIKLVDQFESAWKQGEAPRLTEFLGIAESPERRQELIELLVPIDVEYRLKMGENVQPADYVVAVGSHADDFLEKVISQVRGEKQYFAVTETKSFPSSRASELAHIGPYKLLQKLGEGGMGTVWMAEQQFPVRRRVALKLIKSGIDNEQVLARFEAERQALAMMDHQNIAKVLDAGTTRESQPFFVMELIQGIPLTKYCDQNKLSVKERLELFVPICQAVQHAHQKGVIHRDLKPSNILVSLYDGMPVPKVIDFGLAKALQHQTRLTDRTLFTEFGQVVGTLQYMSPEQAEMNQLDVDTRTDIYSLGVILYELLTGFTPIESDLLKQQAVLKILATIREQDPPRPSAKLSSSKQEVISGVSEQRRIEPTRLKSILRGELDWIVMKALEKDRTRRYSSASGLSREIERFLAGDPVEARPPSASYRLRKFVNKNRGLVSSVIAITTLLLLGLTGTAWYAVEATKARSDAESKRELAERMTVKAEKSALQSQFEAKRASEAERTASDERNNAQQASELANRNLEKANWRLAQSHAQNGRMRDAYVSLASIPPKRRELEWHVAINNFDKSDFTLATGYFSKIAIDPSSSNVAITCGDRIDIWDATLLNQRCSWPAKAAVRDIEYAPDGTKLATTGEDGFLRIWKSETGELLYEVKSHDYCESCSFHPKGEYIATVGSTEKEASSIRIWEFRSGELRASSRITTPKSFCVAFAPHGNLLASSGRDGVAIWDWKNSKEVEGLVRHDPWDVHANWPSLTWNPLATKLFSGNANNAIAMWDLVTQERNEFAGHQDATMAIAWSPDGARLATAGVDSLIRIYDAQTHSLELTLAGHMDTVEQLAFSPDSSRIYSASWDRTVKSWDMRTGAPIIPFHSGFSQRCATPDTNSDYLLIESYEANGLLTKLWDLRNFEELGLPDRLTRSTAACLSPDGAQIFAAVEGEGVYSWTINDWESQTKCFETNQLIKYLEMSQDSKYLGIQIAADKGNLVIWDVNSQTRLHEVDCLAMWEKSPVFTRDSSHFCVLLADHGFQRKLEIREIRSGVVAFAGRVSNYFPSPVRNVLAFTSEHEHILQMQDLQTSKSVAELVGHAGPIYTASFSATGNRVATTGSDRTVRLWDWENGEELLELYKLRLNRSGYSVRDITISNDSKWIIVASATSPDEPLPLYLICGMNDMSKRVFCTDSTIVRTSFVNQGKSVFAETAKGAKYIWDFETGDSLAPEESVSIAKDLQVSWTHGEWQLSALNNLLVAYRQPGAEASYDRAFRKYKTQFDSVWNTQLLEKARRRLLESKTASGATDGAQHGDSLDLLYGLLFRQLLAWKVSSRTPNDLRSLVDAHVQWLRQYQRESPFIRGMPSIERSSKSGSNLQIDVAVATSLYEYLGSMGDLDAKSAESLNQIVWDEVKKSSAIHDPFLLDLQKEIYRKHPTADYLNTLGVAYFRAEMYPEAIEALKKSVVELQKEKQYPLSFPGDLAFLALSELALGNRVEAKIWYSQLLDSMNHAEFKDDAECSSFLREATELFVKEGIVQESK